MGENRVLSNTGAPRAWSSLYQELVISLYVTSTNGMQHHFQWQQQFHKQVQTEGINVNIYNEIGTDQTDVNYPRFAHTVLKDS